MADTQVQVNDVSLTDGQSAVWGGAMTQAMRLHLLAGLEGTGLATVEVANSETIAQAVRRGENPWQYLDLVRHQAPGLALRTCLNVMTEHGRKGGDVLTGDVINGWINELAGRGIAEIVFIDPLADMARLKAAFGAAATQGVTATGTVIYAGDSTSDADYAAQAKALTKAGASAVMLRDEAGLLSADTVATLIPALKKALAGVPLTLHTTCTTGLGPKAAGNTVQLGVDGIDTALPALANGGSAPSSVNLATSMAAIDIQLAGPNTDALKVANAVAQDIADSQGFDAATPWGFDLAPYVHKLPGTVAAWAMHAMTSHGLRVAKLHEFAHECERVRADIGSPPMVSPFARGVAEQAMANLTGGARYNEICPLIRRIVQGVYGGVSGVDADLLAWLGAVEPQEASTLADLRQSAPGASDREHLLQVISGCPAAQQPAPAKLADIVYRQKTPAEHLAEGAKARVAKYGTVHITGPGIDIRETHGGAA